MKNVLLLLSILCFTHVGIGQTSLFTEDFESGGGTFDLNTSDLGGLSASSGSNQWIVNSWYTEGWGTDGCTFSDQYIANTTAQPSGITSANGNYLHIYSDEAMTWTGAGEQPTQNCNYMPADPSCSGAQSYFAMMNSDVSTTGKTDVELSFWWLCEANAYAYGEVYYSTDGGSSWTQITSPISEYYGESTWAEQTLTDAAWDDQATLRFAFRFVMESDPIGYDVRMALGVDDVEIVATDGPACSDTFNSFTVDECDAYTVPSGDETITSTATVNDTIPNAEGCDSIMTITVNITTVDAGVTLVEDTLKADATGGGITYQWIDCSDSSAISGATDEYYVVDVNGTYAVIVTDGSCSDTSDCMLVEVEGIVENGFGSHFKLYPNPSDDIINIDLGKVYQDFELSIVDVSGRVLTKNHYEQTDLITDLKAPEAPGTYLIHITTKDGEHAILNCVVK